MLYKHYQFKRKSKICLEITSEHSCILIDVIQLPMCPSFYEINIPTSISDLEVKGDWYSPKLHVKWPEFTIKDSKSSTIKTIKSELCITFWQAFKLKSILKDTFFCVFV